jgi:hypothetical protein
MPAIVRAHAPVATRAVGTAGILPQSYAMPNGRGGRYWTRTSDILGVSEAL